MRITHLYKFLFFHRDSILQCCCQHRSFIQAVLSDHLSNQHITLLCITPLFPFQVQSWTPTTRMALVHRHTTLPSASKLPIHSHSSQIPILIQGRRPKTLSKYRSGWNPYSLAATVGGPSHAQEEIKNSPREGLSIFYCPISILIKLID